MADDFPDFVKFDGFAGQAWYHQMIRDKRILRRAREFTPERLFKSGEQGVWYDPSDTTTLFKDSAGTTPVTASGQPVGRMLDKSGRGNHATQPTAASRPIYRRGDSRGVVNLLPWSEEFGNSVWSKSTANIQITPNTTIAPDGTRTADTLSDVGSGDDFTANIVRIPNDAQSWTCSVYLLKTTGATNYAAVWCILSGGTLVGGTPAVVNTNTGVITSGIGDVHDAGAYWRVTKTAQNNSSGNIFAELRLNPAFNATGAPVRGNAATGSVVAWGAQLNLGPTALPYQRNDSHLGGVATGASTDLHWLECDGVDDGMVTGSIDFTGTDKVSVFAGVRKLSDATAGVVVELSNNGAGNSGGLGLLAPNFTAEASYGFRSNQGTPASVAARGLASPRSDVLTAMGEVGVPIKLGVSGAENTGPLAGTGTYGNYPLYLFRRGGTSLPFNGWFYGMAITGRLTTDAETVATERLLAAKSAVVIP